PGEIRRDGKSGRRQEVKLPGRRLKRAEANLTPRRVKSDGKANCNRYEFTPGDLARRECSGRCGEDYARAEGSQCGDREEVRRAHYHKRRGDGGEGDPAAGYAREHVGADGQESGSEAFRRSRRRHALGDRAGPGDLPRRRKNTSGWGKPDGPEAGHREGGGSCRRGDK